MKTDDLIAAIAADNRFAGEQAGRHRRLLFGPLVLAAIISGALFLGIAGIRSDVAEPGVASAIFRKEILALFVAATGLGLAWVSSRPESRDATLLLVPLLVLAALVGWELVMLGPKDWAHRMIGQTGPVCLVMIPTIATLPLVALLALLKNRAPSRPGVAGASAGLAAAGIGAAIYATHCTEDSMLFVAFWYGLASALLVTIGALTGRRSLRW